LFSADPLKKKYDPKAILKIRKEIIIEARRGFFKRNNNDKAALSCNNFFPNKLIDEHVIEEFIIMTTLTLLSLNSKLVGPFALNYGFVEKQGKVDALCFRSR
jgi:hypothetical protein